MAPPYKAGEPKGKDQNAPWSFYEGSPNLPLLPPPYSISPPYLRTQFMGLDHLRSLFTPTVDVAPIGVGEHLPHSRP